MVTGPEELVNDPKILPANEGFRYAAGPQNVRVMLSSAETNGSFCMAEITIDEPHFGPPLHMHTHEDEMFLVREGELHVTVDGVVHVVKPGGMAYAPRNVPHTFAAGPEGVRFELMITGSNFERFHQRYSEAMEKGEMHRLVEIGEEHGIRFLTQ